MVHAHQVNELIDRLLDLVDRQNSLNKHPGDSSWVKVRTEERDDARAELHEVLMEVLC